MFVLALVPVVSMADVVPPEAVDAASAWLALVDQGRYREAAQIALVTQERSNASLVLLASHLSADLAARGPTCGTALPRSRLPRVWTGHGDGDSSRMAPGSWFSVEFETTCASGRSAVDDVPLVPRGDGTWRVVGYQRR